MFIIICLSLLYSFTFSLWSLISNFHTLITLRVCNFIISTSFHNAIPAFAAYKFEIHHTGGDDGWFSLLSNSLFFVKIFKLHLTVPPLSVFFFIDEQLKVWKFFKILTYGGNFSPDNKGIKQSLLLTLARQILLRTFQAHNTMRLSPRCRFRPLVRTVVSGSIWVDNFDASFRIASLVLSVVNFSL